MKVIRVLIYEGDDAWVKKTLSHSMPEGIFKPNETESLTIITVSTAQNQSWDIVKEVATRAVESMPEMVNATHQARDKWEVPNRE